MILFGCAMTSPVAVRQYLSKKKIPRKTLTIGTVMDESYSSFPYILILKYSDFTRNLKVLESFEGVKVVLFASIVRLKNVQGLTCLDADLDVINNYRFNAPNYRLLSRKTESDVEIVDDFLPELINNFKSGSLLNGLMTWIYGIPSTNVQHRVTDMVIRWMFEGSDIATLKVQLKKTLKTRSLDGLLEILEGEIGVNYTKGFRAVGAQIREEAIKPKPINYKLLKKKFGIATYEARYCTFTYRKIRKPKNLDGKTVKEIYYDREENKKKRRRAPTTT